MEKDNFKMDEENVDGFRLVKKYGKDNLLAVRIYPNYHSEEEFVTYWLNGNTWIKNRLDREPRNINGNEGILHYGVLDIIEKIKNGEIK